MRSEFVNDLRQALNAWKSSPWLPVTSVSVALLGEVQVLLLDHTTGAAFALAFVATGVTLLISIGYVGTERIWYLRVFRGVSTTPNLVLKLSRDFLGRYFVLGLMFSGPFWVYAISVVLLLHRARLPLWYWVGGYFIVMAADFALTFVTPALAYSTRKATAAARIGIGMMNLHFAK